MNPWTLATEEHIYGFEGTTAQSIFIAGFAGLVLVAMLVTKMSLRQWILAAVLMITCLSPAVSAEMTQYNPTWMLSVQVARPKIHLVLGGILTLLVMAGGGFNARYFSIQGVLVLLMALYAGIMQFAHENADPMSSIEAIGFAMATIPCVIVASSLASRTFEGCFSLLKMLMWVSTVWTFCCSVQFIINPRYLVSSQGRFMGLLGNAQHAAVLVAVMAVVALWLLLHDPNRRARVFWGTMIAVNLLFLIWTASRTGGLMFVIGSSAVLYSRLGRAVALLPVAALIAWGLAQLADALRIGANLERFVNVEDTRLWVWQGQLQAAWENPIAGVGFSRVAGTENSYLVAFAAYGLGYFLLTLLLLAVSVWHCFTAITRRRSLAPEHRPMIDIFVAFMAMYFAGAMFEGYMHARSFCPQVLLLIFSSIGLWIRHEAADGRLWEHAHADEEQDYADSADVAVAHE